jgi:hypothetical protein
LEQNDCPTNYSTSAKNPTNESPASAESGQRNGEGCILQLASHTFVEAGLALAEIRDDELFIDEFDSFDAYCQEKWQYGKRYAERLMAAAEVVKRLRTNSSLPSPSYQGQVRPLMGLSADQAIAAWGKQRKRLAAARSRLGSSPLLSFTPPARRTGMDIEVPSRWAGPTQSDDPLIQVVRLLNRSRIAGVVESQPERSGL